MHGSKLEASACKRCDGGQCESCKQVLRCFRLAVRRGLVQPRFAEAMKAVGLVVEGELHEIAADQADARAVGLGGAGGVGEALVGAVDVVGEVDREAAGLDVGDELVERAGRVGAALGGPELADIEGGLPVLAGEARGAGADLHEAALAADEIVGVIAVRIAGALIPGLSRAVRCAVYASHVNGAPGTGRAEGSGVMSKATVLRMYAREAESTATRTGRADYRRVATLLAELAARADASARTEAARKRRLRARVPAAPGGTAPEQADLVEYASRTASRDTAPEFTGSGPQSKRTLRKVKP